MKKNSLAHQILAETSSQTKQFVRRYAEITLRIQQIMDEKGWSQSDLAKRLGKKPPEISKWLRGNHNFTLRSLAALEAELGAEIFNVPLTKKVATMPSHSPVRLRFSTHRSDNEKPVSSSFLRTSNSVSLSGKLCAA
ncbi:MAG: helix-turn-helix transcriptional regulator [Saprospiraceae bacterium]|nr:helix-turn-helix transcriptional regulator [Saprospiraceae bacterium]